MSPANIRLWHGKAANRGAVLLSFIFHNADQVKPRINLELWFGPTPGAQGLRSFDQLNTAPLIAGMCELARDQLTLGRQLFRVRLPVLVVGLCDNRFRESLGPCVLNQPGNGPHVIRQALYLGSRCTGRGVVLCQIVSKAGTLTSVLYGFCTD
jgi:hypothetical protein